MSKPKVYGSYRSFTRNDRADQRYRPKQFFRQKDRVEDAERIEKKFQETLEKGKQF